MKTLPHPLGKAPAYPRPLLDQQAHQLHVASSSRVAEGGHAVLRHAIQAGTKLQEQSDHLLMAKVRLDAQDRGVIQHLRPVVHVGPCQNQEPAHLLNNIPQQDYFSHKCHNIFNSF